MAKKYKAKSYDEIKEKYNVSSPSTEAKSIDTDSLNSKRLSYEDVKAKYNSGEIKTGKVPYSGVDIDTRFKNTMSTFTNYAQSYKPVYGINMADVLKSQRDKTLDVNSLMRDINANRSTLGEEKYNTMMDSLKKVKEGYKDILNNAHSYSQFESEEAYNNFVDDYQKSYQNEEYKNMLRGIDLEKDENEIDTIKANRQYVSDYSTGGYDPYNSLRDKAPMIIDDKINEYLDRGFSEDEAEERAKNDLGGSLDAYDVARYLASQQVEKTGYNSLEEMDSDIENRELLHHQARLLQTKESLENDARDAYQNDVKGFIQTSAEGKSNKDDEIVRLRSTSGALSSYELINSTQNLAGKVDRNNNINYLAARYMTNEEYDTYTYYLGIGDSEKAKTYLDTLTDVLGQRQGAKMFSEMEGDALKEILFGVSAGLDQFSTGLSNVFGERSKNEYLAPTGYQNASYLARQDLANDDGSGNLGTVLYDLTTTTSNMIPSILTSYVIGAFNPVAGAIVGDAMMGTSAAGQAYQEMIQKGYTKEQAMTYGKITGTLESTLQYALGGVSKLGGKVSGNAVRNFANNISEGIGKFSVKWGNIAGDLMNYGGNMFSEGLEEFLQDILAPHVEALATGGKAEFEDTYLSDALYSGLLGMLSAGFLESVNTVGEVASSVRSANEVNDIIDLGLQEKLIDVGKSFDASTVAYQIADKVDSNTSAWQLSKLLREVNGNIGQQTLNDIKSELVQRGMREQDAKIISEALAKSVLSDKFEFTPEQIKMLEDNEVISDVYVDVVLNKNSTVNQRLSGMLNMYGNEGYIGSDFESIKASSNSDNISNTSSEILAREFAKAEYEKKIGTLKVTQEEKKTSTPFDNSVKSFKRNNQVHNVLDSVSEKISEDGVSVSKVESIKDGKMILQLKDGKKVDSRNVKYKSKNQAVIYESALRLGMTPNVANAVANGYNALTSIGVEDYMYGVEQAYQYGKLNYDLKYVSSEGFLSNLSDSQKRFAYDLGRQDAETFAKQQNKKIKKNENISRDGNISLPVPYDTLTKVQKHSVDALDKVVKAVTHNNVIMYESVLNENGNRVFKEDVDNIHKAGDSAPNGWYEPSTKNIYIDINAGDNGEGTILWTASHEFTHFMRDTAPLKFKELADFLFDAYGKKGVNVNKLIDAQIAKAKANGNTLSRDIAYEEVVADAMQPMFTDTNLSEKLQKLKLSNEGLWNKLKDFFTDLYNKIKDVYSTFTHQTDEARIVHDMVDKLEKISDLFAEGLVEGGNNFEHMENVKSSYIVSKVEDLTNGAVNDNGEQLFQYRAMQHDIPEYKNILLKHGMSSKDITKLFNMVDKVIDKVKSNLEILDYDWDVDIDDRPLNPVKPNSDSLYKFSVDFSTLCRKRILQQIVQVQLQEALDRAITREESIAIRDELIKIQNEGREIEVACALCYVESARMKSPAQIQKFLDNRTKVIKEYFANKDGGDTKTKKLNAEINARNKLAKQYAKEIEEGVYNDPSSYDVAKNGNKKYTSLKALPGFMRDEIRNAKKSVLDGYELSEKELELINIAEGLSTSDFTSPDGLLNLLKKYPEIYDAYISYVRNATKSKGLEKDTWWRIGDSFKIGDDLIASMNKENGLRSQSWSDFQAIHTLDYIAAIIELSTRDAKMQVYTKVPDYVKLMGYTNQMINLSLIPKALFNGILEYDPIEGMDFNKALELRNKYPSTAGTICIGINDNQIKMLLESDLIDYVIPYHQSGMSKVLRKAMNIPTWVSYESFQNEKELSKKDAENYAESIGVELISEKSDEWHKKPSFSEWFDIKEASEIASDYNKKKNSELSAHEKEMKNKYGIMFGGYIAMQKMADKYIKLCAERGLNPKFCSEKLDFTTEDNYWKLLIDRKMINNKTGEIIKQKAVKPNFKESDVLEILEDEVKRYPGVMEDQNYATKTVVKKFLSGGMNDEINAINKITGAVQKSVDNVTKVNILESARDISESNHTSNTDILNSARVNDKKTLNFLNEQLARGEYDKNNNPNGGYYVTYKSMSFWGYDENGNAILRSPMAEYVDGKLSDAYIINSNGEPNWYESTEILDEETGIPKGLLLKIDKDEKANYPKDEIVSMGGKYFLKAYKHPDLIADDWSNCYYPLYKKVEDGVDKKGNVKYTDSPVPARYAPYEHSSNLMLNDQFEAAWRRANLVTVKMYVPVSEENEHFRAKYAKDATGWNDWHSGLVASAIRKQKPSFNRQVFLSRYATPVEIVSDEEVAKAYKEYISGTDIKILDNVVSPNLLKELKKIGVPIKETGKIKFEAQNNNGTSRYSNRDYGYHAGDLGKSESLAQQGYGRDTGHFGTGTYFVGDESKISGDTTYGKRPHEKVDFSNYNLFKIKNSSDGYALHKFLRGVDGFYDLDENEIRTEEEWERRKDDLDNALYDYSQDGVGDLNDLISEAIALFGNYGLGKEFTKNAEAPDGYEFWTASDGSIGLYNKTTNEDIELSIEDYQKYADMTDVISELIYDNRYAPRWVGNIESFDESFEDATRILGVSEKKLRSILSEIKKDIEDANYGYESRKTADSAATRLMKKLGYEGIDVRGTSLDNTAYGSVIYDLKGDDLARKKEIGTARYSERVLMGSVFSGGGTLEAGLVYQMLDKEFAVEYNKKLASVYTDNHGKEHMFVGDVRDFNSKEKRNVFYLHASPVCKNFSNASHKAGETSIDITTAEATARILEEQMPEVFTVENVKRYKGSEAYNIIISKLNELGYTWDSDVYKASDYGNATKRERLIVRAVKNGELPAKPAKVDKKTTWYEATKDLFDTDLIPSTLVKSKIDAIKNTPGISISEIMKSDKPIMIYDTTKSKQINYAWGDELAPTLTTKCGDARIIWNGKVYEPTPKFMGRIQGLPDDYVYPSAKTNAFKIIGNGIPTQLTKAVMGGVLDSAYAQTHDGDILYSGRNPATYKGQEFWSGAVNLDDGIIEEVHSIEEAQNADFHHSLYFSENAVEKIDDGEWGFFYVDNGNVNGLWRDDISDDIIRKVTKQINIIDNQDIKYSDRNVNASDPRTLLSNALATTAKTDAEKKYISEYQLNIDKINAEQAKLADLRSQIKDISFGKGTRDNAKLAKLQEEATKTANRINIYDKKLFKLESTKPLKDVLDREKAKARKKAEAEGREALNAYKEKAEQRQKDIIEKYKEKEQNAKIRRENADIRNKIKKLVDELSSRELNPKVNRYIPSDLINTVSDVLSAINLDSGRSEKLTNKLALLKAKYDAMKKNNIHDVAYDETVSDMIDDLISNIGDTSIYDMTREQLELTHNTLKALLHTIKTAVKVRNIESEKNAFEISNEMRLETNAVSKSSSSMPARWLQTQLRPQTMFERFAGFKKDSMWGKVYRMLDKAQNNKMRIEMEANDIFKDVFKNEKYLKQLTDTNNLIDIGLKDDDGNTVKVTRGMALTIHMALMNEDNARHMMIGGITVPDIKKYYKGSDDAYGIGHIVCHGIGSKGLAENQMDISDAKARKREALEKGNTFLADQIDSEIEMLEAEREQYIADGNAYLTEIDDNISAMLNEDDKKFLSAAKEFFDDYSKKELNKTTMELYGFEKALIENYLPIHTDPNFRKASFEQITKDFNLENSGFMKDRVNASNPIMLEDLSEIINSQINKVARYCGFTIAIKDFNKIYSKAERGFASSLQDTISSKFGTPGKTYIENLLSDIVGSRSGETTFFDRARGYMAGATLSINPRVAMAQAASLPTAASEIGWKPILKASGKFVTKHDIDLIAEYTPLLYNRSKGANIELADVKKMSQKQNQIMRKLDWLMGWIEAIDKRTVGTLWYASQYYVDDNFDLVKGSDDYYKKVAEVFSDVVERTQPNYSVMQRPDILRNPNAVVKQLTMFMTQRLQNFNIVYEAGARLNKYNADFKSNRNGITSADVSEARTGLVRALSSQIVASAMIVGIKFLADMLLHSMNAYRDDDKELTEESINATLLENFLDTAIGNMLGGSELYSVLNSIITKDRYYGVTLNGVGAIADSVEDFVSLTQNPSLEKCNTFAKSVCTFLGIPLGNAEKIGLGIYNHIIDYMNGEFGSFESGIDRNTTQRINISYRAFVEGDMEKFDKHGLINSNQSAVTKVMKPIFLDAYKANDNETMANIRKYLNALGIYTDVVKITQNWIKNSEK